MVVLSAELSLVEIPDARQLLVLGFEDIATAADAVPALLTYRPSTIEGMDHEVVDNWRKRKVHASLDLLP